MSVARTARRRRKQASLGFNGLKQVYGSRHCPIYPGVISKEKSAKRLARVIKNANISRKKK